MRTLQVINVKWFNATSWYAVCLAYILHKNGHPSAIVAVQESCFIPLAKSLGLTVYELPLNSHNIKDIITCSKQINAICQSFKPDIVNCHRGESFFLWALKKKKFNYNLVRTRGDQRLPSTDFFNRFLHNKTADAVIATNTKMTEYFAKKMRTPREKLYTILGGVDTSKFCPMPEQRTQMRAEKNFTDNDILIGVIGRFDPVKGFKEALKSFSDLFKDVSYSKSLLEENSKKLHLVFVGRSCMFTGGYLKKLGNDLGIPEQYFHVLENVPSIEKTMNMLDMGLIASIDSEAIARVAFEMIACGVPLISSEVGVMPDIVTEEYRYRVGDFHRLTELFLKTREEDFRNEGMRRCQLHLEGKLDQEQISYVDRRENSLKECEEKKKTLEDMLNSHKNLNTSIFNSGKFNIYGWALEDFLEKTVVVYEWCLKNKTRQSNLGGATSQTHRKRG